MATIPCARGRPGDRDAGSVGTVELSPEGMFE
jgi:hypothetical protein